MKNLSALISCLALLTAFMLASGEAWAQNRIYRCGNLYTNNPKGHSNCTLVEGGNITIVETPKVRPAPAPSRPQAAPSAPARSGASAASSAAQRKRDADARAILQNELDQAQAKRAALLEEYNDGQPDRLGNERNYQKYLDRVERIKQDLERNQSDIDGIQRELKRLG